MRIKQIYIVLFSGVVLGFIACKTSSKDALVKKWKATNAEGIIVTSEIKKGITDEKKTLEFTKDSRCIAYNNGQKFDRGTYILSGDAKTIHISSGTGHIQNIRVLELSNDKLIGEVQGITITFEPSK